VHPPYLVPYPPMQARTPTRGREMKATPPTPLDSLLSAVKSVMDEEGAGVGSSSEARDGLRLKGSETGARNKVGKARRASVIDVPESPVSRKRRKVMGKNTMNAGVAAIRGQKAQTEVESPSSGLGRMKSALDVLADQAAVFSSKTVEPNSIDRGRRESVDPGRTAVQNVHQKKVDGNEKNKKGKGMEMADDFGDEEGERDNQAGVVFSMLDDHPTAATCLSPTSSRQESCQFSRKWKNGPSLRPVTRWGAEVNQSPVAGGAGMGDENTTVRNQEEDAEGGADQGEDAQVSLSIHMSPPTTPPPLPPPLLPLPALDTNVDSDVPSHAISGPRGKAEGRQRRRQSNELPSPIMLPRSQSEDRQTSPRSLVFTGPEKPEIRRRASSIPLHSTSPSSQQGHCRTDRNSSKVRGGDVAFEEEEQDDPADAVDTVLESGALRGNGGNGGENRDLERAGSQGMQMQMPGKRPRSPYVKWSKDEDDLLSQVFFFSLSRQYCED
jgi:hypothetical protein